MLAARAGDASAIAEFLKRHFHLDPSSPLLDAKQMEWKYWTPRPDWSGSRSFIVRRDGAIAAHAAAWPVTIRVSGEAVHAAHAIDWAADPNHPGAGIWLMRRLASQVGLLIATGGTEITRQLLPLVGFQRHSDLDWFARPVRPHSNLKSAAWFLLHSLSIPRRWSAARIEPEAVPPDLWPQPSPTTAVTARDAASYRYALACPSARHELFGLHKSGTLVGYFCLSFVGREARIADLWLPSTSVADWSAAFRTAAVIAARDRDVDDVSAWGSTARAKDGLARAGFRRRDRSALSCLGNASMLHERELHVQMLDCDASYL